MRQVLIALSLTALFAGGCPVVIPTPHPSPTPQATPVPTPFPTPTPTPPPYVPAIDEPMRVDGQQRFSYKGQPIRLLGSIICCSEGVNERGWPLINQAAIDEIAAHGGNFTHIRLGPFRNEDDPGNEAILPDGNWNPVFWTRVDTLLEHTRQKGVFVEVDIIDGWAAKTGNLWWGYSCNMMTHPPDEAQVAFIRKAVEVAGKYPNVMWQLSNESGVDPCGIRLTAAWELGIAREVLANEQLFSYPHHLIGTNAGDRHPDIQFAAELDYINVHEDVALTQEGPRPLVVNEWGALLTPEEWASIAREARRKGSIFHMWRAETWGEAENQRALDLLKEIQDEP